jgi:hypothetical protein
MGTVLTTLGSGKKGNGVPLAVTLKRKKRYRRDGKGLTDVHKTPPGKPQRGTSGSGCAKNREVGEQFKDAQQALTTALERMSGRPVFIGSRMRLSQRIPLISSRFQ